MRPVHPRNMARILGTEGDKRGKTHERLVLEALALPSRPAWIVSARKATRAEDRDGIDVVVESDVGKLYVQVKSSKRGKNEFLERRRRAEVAIVIVRPSASEDRLLRQVVGELTKIRAKYLAQRG